MMSPYLSWSLKYILILSLSLVLILSFSPSSKLWLFVRKINPPLFYLTHTGLPCWPLRSCPTYPRETPTNSWNGSCSSLTPTCWTSCLRTPPKMPAWSSSGAKGCLPSSWTLHCQWVKTYLICRNRFVFYEPKSITVVSQGESCIVSNEFSCIQIFPY